MNAISTFIDNQDTIYNHRQAVLFKNRRTVSVASSSTSKAVAGNGKPIYYKIKNGDTLGGIAQRYGVSVSKLRSWNSLRGNNIRAGKTLKIYKFTLPPLPNNSGITDVLNNKMLVRCQNLLIFAESEVNWIRIWKRTLI